MIWTVTRPGQVPVDEQHERARSVTIIDADLVKMEARMLRHLIMVGDYKGAATAALKFIDSLGSVEMVPLEDVVKPRGMDLPCVDTITA